MESHESPQKSHGSGSFFWWLGAGSIVWLLLRSGRNPKRLAYPCQQAALAGSLGFLWSLLAALGMAGLLHRLRRTASGARALAFAGALAVLFLFGVTQGPSTRARATSVTLPGWTSAAAVSSVFVVRQVPVPTCSLDGGILPSAPPCNSPETAFADAGIDRLVSEMEGRGDYFFRTGSHPTGIVGSDAVVVLKINNQWGAQGDGNGLGRLTTNTDLLKGLIWRILNHPGGFSGEIVVAENTQDVNANWDTTPANAEDQGQSFRDVVNAFRSQGHPVSFSDWDSLNWTLVSGGSVHGNGYPAGEYAQGDFDDGYILLDDPDSSGTNELSYPKFRTAEGRYVSLRYGVWNGTGYDSSRLTLINIPVLKKHVMAGSTIAWKNLIGFITISNEGGRFGGWDRMHDFFWGYTSGTNAGYGLIGRQLALIRAPDLNIVDAIWVATDDNTAGNAVREDVVLGSRDPFAVDWYASEYLLEPLVSWDNADSSAARRGVFRSATRVNQNSAQATWPNGEYPYIDLLDGVDGNDPVVAEQNQMNVYVVNGSGGAPTPTPTTGPGTAVPIWSPSTRLPILALLLGLFALGACAIGRPTRRSKL